MELRFGRGRTLDLVSVFTKQKKLNLYKNIIAIGGLTICFRGFHRLSEKNKWQFKNELIK